MEPVKNTFILFMVFNLAFACQKPGQNTFDPSKSHPQAIAIADEVIEASGGQAAWDSTNYLAWDFFGRRRLIWDKLHQRARITALDSLQSYDIIVDLTTKKGLVKLNGEPQSHPDSLVKYLDRGYKMWVNDSYWLVMPFKLKDPGVKLHYLGEDSTQANIFSDVIDLTFDSVGVTPQNRYAVWVGKKTRLVVQWAYFANAKDTVPAIINPWHQYLKYGGLFLASDRGTRGELTNIKVYDELPASVFTSLDPVEF